MLMGVKNQIKVTMLSIKYATMREMLNKASFLTNVLFMILNDASFILQWIILYSLKDNVGGYTLNQVMILWGLAASTYGFSHFFFAKATSLSDTITNGKLDAYLVQPKNVLISAITSDVSPAALGDMAYGIIMLFASGITLTKFFLFILFTITGGIIVTSMAVILGSLSFWISRADMIADTGNGLMINFSTYPDGIFKGITRVLFFTIIPVGIANYMPIWIITKFNLGLTIIVLSATFFITFIAFFIFYKGLKRYCSSNLMIAKI